MCVFGLGLKIIIIKKRIKRSAVNTWWSHVWEFSESMYCILWGSHLFALFKHWMHYDLWAQTNEQFSNGKALILVSGKPETNMPFLNSTHFTSMRLVLSAAMSIISVIKLGSIRPVQLVRPEIEQGRVDSVIGSFMILTRCRTWSGSHNIVYDYSITTNMLLYALSYNLI